jgi:hypothetical protein
VPSNELYITVGEVVARLEIDPSEITPETVPLSSTGVEGYLNDAEAQAASILARASLSFSSIDDADLGMLKAMVLDYAVSQSLATMGQRGSVNQAQAQTQWTEALARLESRASHLTTRSGDNAASNAPTNGRAPKFSGRNYDF